MELVAGRNAVDVSNYVSNGEWRLTSTDVERHAVIYPVSPSAVYPHVTVSLHMSRRVLYYLLNIIVPCVWLNLPTFFLLLSPGPRSRA